MFSKSVTKSPTLKPVLVKAGVKSMCILYQLKPSKRISDILVDMNGRQTVMLGITGTNGAGKGTVVEYLVKKEGFGHFSASGLITEEIIKRNLPVNRDNMILVANDLRAKNGAGYIALELLKRAGESQENRIIESIRTLGEVGELKRRGGMLLAVDADQKLRYERIKKRGGEKDGVSYEEFAEQEKKEMMSEDPNKQNLTACRKMADFLIENNGTIEELEQKINEILKIIKKNE